MTAVAARDSRPSLVGSIALAVVFAVGYGWQLFGAISNLVSLPAYYDAIGASGSTPWWLLIVGLAAPVLLFVGALLLGRRRTLVQRAVVLAAGLAAASTIALSSVALVGVL